MRKQPSKKCLEVLLWHLVFDAGLRSVQIWCECCSTFGACYMSQKVSKIKRNDEKDRCEPIRTFQSSMHLFKKYTNRVDKNKTVTQVSRMAIDNVHLATSAWLICEFWICWIPKLIVYLPHTDKYILHSRQTSNDQSGKARWKWHAAECHGHLSLQCHDLTSASRRSPNQPTRSITKCSQEFVCSPRSTKLQSVGNVCLA